MGKAENIQCRLCGNEASHAFNKTLLERYKVAFYQCKKCASQQTEEPYWLDEAYNVPGVHIDVGSVSRSLKNWLGASLLLDQLGYDRDAKYVDFGSGFGIFARLMRDVGYNFLSFDKFTTPALTNYFLSDGMENTKVITAFEVFEHLPEPKETLTRLFELDAELIFFTTWFCDDQKEDWIYYLPECGQHVFFYSENALREFAAGFGYELTLSHFFMVLSKSDIMSDEQKETIFNFSINSMEIANNKVQDQVMSVIMGNDFIDSDLEYARDRFSREISKYAKTK